ncbi:unnamed protein product [Didymodactylos carnosus]|uniref:Transposase domain-containing protein n=1 Tax=Didymodactylos carnosus TaxID=1234261 RepID=A0A8S2CWR8_9BILA|nr:unnamed protein product [Didymodactylos carnosus]CAF3607537.1 unnamed protein product [Didymodactylos carnosus]
MSGSLNAFEYPIGIADVSVTGRGDAYIKSEQRIHAYAGGSASIVYQGSLLSKKTHEAAYLKANHPHENIKRSEFSGGISAMCRRTKHKTKINREKLRSFDNIDRQGHVQDNEPYHDGMKRTEDDNDEKSTNGDSIDDDDDNKNTGNSLVPNDDEESIDFPVNTSRSTSPSEANDSPAPSLQPIINTSLADNIHRRSDFTAHDIAASQVIMKVRRCLNNQDMDYLCKWTNALQVKNLPKCWASIVNKINKFSNLNIKSKPYRICSQCSSTNKLICTKCKHCQCEKLFDFYQYPLIPQVQHLLLIPNNYSKMKHTRFVNAETLYNTTYGTILNENKENSFTMLLNSDGIVTPNKHLALWPVILMVNEIPFPFRRYTENVLLAGVIHAPKKPTAAVIETALDLITEELLELENGLKFYVPELRTTTTFQFYLIATCNDKPAESSIGNMTAHNGLYGCKKCFAEGEVYHGQTVYKRNVKRFNIRVYPYEIAELRTSDEYKKVIVDIENEEIEPPSMGHYVDTLHGVYSGVFKKLLTLFFDKTHRKEKWSLFRRIEDIDIGLSLITIPSTTTRRFRGLKNFMKFKANEYRSLFHFGASVFSEFLKEPYRSNYLQFVTAINLASEDHITSENMDLIEKLLDSFVKQYQQLYGLRHMQPNVHSMLHIHQTVRFIGPLFICSTFNFESIGHDLVSMIHGTTEYGKQMIMNHIYYREAIITTQQPDYPAPLLNFVEDIMCRKKVLNLSYTKMFNYHLSRPVDINLYENELQRIHLFLNNKPFQLHHSIVVNNCTDKTNLSSKNPKFNDSCVSFRFGAEARFGLIRAVISTNVKILLLIEQLTDNDNKLRFRHNNVVSTVRNIFYLKRSQLYHLRSPNDLIQKHCYRFRPNNVIHVFKFNNLKDSS